MMRMKRPGGARPPRLATFGLPLLLLSACDVTIDRAATIPSAQPRQLDETARQELLAAREQIWRDIFANDREAMARALPEGSMFINADGERFADREDVFAAMADFAGAGGRLARLEFPRTDIQSFGNVAVIYTTYVYDLEIGGETETYSGHATEIFVKDGDTWTNPGWHLDNY